MPGLMNWAWLLNLAAGVTPWLVFRYPEAPVAIRLHPDHIVRGELSKCSENPFAENLVAIRILDKQILTLSFDQVIYNVILVDAVFFLNFA